MDLNYMELCPHDFKWYQTRHRDDGSIEVYYRCRICGARMCDIEYQDMIFE